MRTKKGAESKGKGDSRRLLRDWLQRKRDPKRMPKLTENGRSVPDQQGPNALWS